MLKIEEVFKVAKLARLQLEPKEQTQFKEQLEQVLGLFEKIKKLDLKGVPETSQVTGLKNVCQKDEVIINESSRTNNKEQLLNQAPEYNQDFIIVPKIIN